MRYKFGEYGIYKGKEYELAISWKKKKCYLAEYDKDTNERTQREIYFWDLDDYYYYYNTAIYKGVEMDVAGFPRTPEGYVILCTYDQGQAKKLGMEQTGKIEYELTVKESEVEIIVRKAKRPGWRESAKKWKKEYERKRENDK